MILKIFVIPYLLIVHRYWNWDHRFSTCTEFSEKLTFLSPFVTYVWYQGKGNASFSEKFAYVLNEWSHAILEVSKWMIPCYLGGLNPPSAIFLNVWISGVAPLYHHQLIYHPNCYLPRVHVLLEDKDPDNLTHFFQSLFREYGIRCCTGNEPCQLVFGIPLDCWGIGF